MISEARVERKAKGGVHVFPSELPFLVACPANAAAVKIVADCDAEVECRLAVALLHGFRGDALMFVAAAEVAKGDDMKGLASWQNAAEVGLCMKEGGEKGQQADPEHRGASVFSNHHDKLAGSGS